MTDLTALLVMLLLLTVYAVTGFLAETLWAKEDLTKADKVRTWWLVGFIVVFIVTAKVIL